MVNWRAAAAYGVLPHRSAAGLPTRSCAAAGNVRRYASRSFMSMEQTPMAMFFDNFAAIGLALSTICSRPASPTAPAHLYGLPQYSTRRTAAAPCWIACSTPTSGLYLVELLMKQDHEHGRIDRETGAVPRSQAGRFAASLTARGSSCAGSHQWPSP